MKISHFLPFVFLMFAVMACSDRPEDIKLSDLDTACEYIDAVERCADVILKIMDGKDFDDLDDLKEESVERLENLTFKIQQIVRAADKKYTTDELEECPNYDDVEDKFDLIGF